MSVTGASHAQLSDRERAVLRLLAQGHDAKSIARELGLSVHTINEYLRSARRKLGVTSSREAARTFLVHEEELPKNAVDKPIGVSPPPPDGDNSSSPSKGTFTGRQMALAVGGTLAMSLIAAVALFTFLTDPTAAGPLANWNTAQTQPSARDVVMNKIHLDRQKLTWNGSPISEKQARDYLGITKQMSPQPLLVFSSSRDATAPAKQWVRQLIDEELGCTPSLCLEIVAPAA